MYSKVLRLTSLFEKKEEKNSNSYTYGIKNDLSEECGMRGEGEKGCIVICTAF